MPTRHERVINARDWVDIATVSDITDGTFSNTVSPNDTETRQTTVQRVVGRISVSKGSTLAAGRIEIYIGVSSNSEELYACIPVVQNGDSTSEYTIDLAGQRKLSHHLRDVRIDLVSDATHKLTGSVGYSLRLLLGYR